MLQPSGDRVSPACPHYTNDRCGGCQLQHLNYAAQIEAKSAIIRDGLTRIGKRPSALPNVRRSAKEWRYRTKLTLALHRQGGQWHAGLHPYDDPASVFQLQDCPITDQRVVAVWKEMLSAAELLPRASSLRGSVRLVDEERATMTAVVEGADSWPSSAQFFARVNGLSSLWWKPENRPRQLAAERGVGRAGASFTQINPEVAAELRTHVVSRVRAYAPTSVIDAYAGVGDLASLLSHGGIRVTAIELDEDAADRCGKRLTSPSVSLAGKVEDLLARALPADVVVVNPPRTGLDAKVAALLQSAPSPPRAIVYVSCNPATLGRDLARMPGYAIASVLGFDMFPQTAHVETVCELVPNERERLA